jgi:hypothetical protein
MFEKRKARIISPAPSQTPSTLDESGIETPIVTLSSSTVIISNAPTKVVIPNVTILEFFHGDQNKFKAYIM